MNKAIFWDFDNTLAYRKGMWTQSLVNVLENNGYTDFDRDKISPHFRTELPWNRWTEAHEDYFEGKGWWDFVFGVVSAAIIDAGVSAEDIRKLAVQFRDEYLRLEAWYLFEESIPNLELSLERGFSNVIVSNHTPELEWLAGKLGIAPYFDLILTSAKAGYDKPHEEFFLLAEQEERYDKIYMVGDNYTADIKGGNSRGYTSILVRGDNSAGYEKHAGDLNGIWKYID